MYSDTKSDLKSRNTAFIDMTSEKSPQTTKVNKIMQPNQSYAQVLNKSKFSKRKVP